MALPNPDLTHIQTDLVTSVGTLPAQVRNAIKAAIDLLPAGAQQWTAVNANTVDDVLCPGLVISAPAGGTIPNFRAIFGYASTVTTLEPVAAELDGGTDTTVQNSMAYFGFGPDVSSIGARNWHDADPLGVGVRFSKLTRALPAGEFTKVWCVASAETLWVWLRGSTDARIWMFAVGALIQPWALGADAETDERLYALSSLGSAATNFNASAHTWDFTANIFSGATSANNADPRNRVMLPGVSTMANWRWRHFAVSSGSATEVGTYKTISGKPILHWGSMEAIRSDGGLSYGRLRGIAPYCDDISRRIIRNNGADKAILVNGHMTTVQDCFAFRAG